jgi:ActR/RegA family two-component response regulator
VPVTLLFVGGEPAPELDQFEVLTAAGREDALRLLETRRVDVILAQLRLPDGSGLDLVRECAERYPEPRRILLAAYEDLPQIVAARARGIVSRVLPQAARPERIAKAVGEALAAQEERSVSRTGVKAPELEELLRWSAARLAQVQGAVVRPLPPDARALQLQFVLQGGKRIEALREDVVKQWLWPVKPRDGEVAGKDRKHPVVRMLGGLSPRSEVYARHVPAEKVYAYLALLPWQHENKLTAALGVLPETAFRAEIWELLKAVQAEAVEELSEFALPQMEESSGVGAAIPEYDWIVTRDYVGPDRRHRPTTFLNRFIFLGRRRRVPSRIARATDAYTDVPHPRVWRYAAAYLLLAAIDTVLTWSAVRAGVVQEANPLLRPLVLHHPWLFLAVKNGVAVGAFLAVVRFQLFRLGMWALRAAVAAYLLLDVYWVVLLRW